MCCVLNPSCAMLGLLQLHLKLACKASPRGQGAREGRARGRSIRSLTHQLEYQHRSPTIRAQVWVSPDGT